MSVVSKSVSKIRPGPTTGPRADCSTSSARTSAFQVVHAVLAVSMLKFIA